MAFGHKRLAEQRLCFSTSRHAQAWSPAEKLFANDGWAGALTAICTADLDGNGATQLIWGTNMNNLYALDSTNGDGGDEIVVTTPEGLHMLDARGSSVASFAADSRIIAMDLGLKLLVGTEDGKVKELASAR